MPPLRENLRERHEIGKGRSVFVHSAPKTKETIDPVIGFLRYTTPFWD
jgi:hypothetical protein